MVFARITPGTTACVRQDEIRESDVRVLPDVGVVASHAPIDFQGLRMGSSDSPSRFVPQPFEAPSRTSGTVLPGQELTPQST